jgi:predicted amidohydrolase
MGMARNVRVASISFGGGDGPIEGRYERARAGAVELLEQAAVDRPDIACLPETFTGLGCGHADWFASAEPVPGPTTEAVGAVAKRHGMWVVCPVVERRGDHTYNAAVLLDRRGEVAGIYHKIHPTISEIQQGITPGTEAAVFETDLGRIGCAICFDLNFRDVIEGLAAGDAELIFFPSMYRGGLQLSIWAHDYGVHIVSATPGEGSAIVDPLGRVLVQSSGYQKILSRVLNLDRRLLHIDENYKKWPAIKAKYGAGVEIDVATPEAVFALISHLPDVTADDIVRDFELELRDDYFRRANMVREESLPPEVGAPLVGAQGRPQGSPLQADGGLAEEMAVMGI